MSEPTADQNVLARQIVEAVLSDLHDRRGYRQTWDDIDEDIRTEIVQTLTTIVERKIVSGPDPAGGNAV